MIPLRLVIDTNIIVSAALKPDGLQRTILLLAITKPARLFVSDAILAEYREVLARPELQIRKGLRLQLLQLIRGHSHSVRPGRPLQVTQDPADNKFRLLSNIYGLTPAQGGDQACDRARVPWLHRCESRKSVWLSLGFCC